MYIRAAKSEGADCGAARFLAPGKRNQLIRNLKRTIGEINYGIGLLEVQCRRNLFVMKYQSSLDQTRDACRVSGIPPVTLHGADLAGLLPGCFGLENF